MLGLGTRSIESCLIPAYYYIVPTLSVGMRLRTLQRPRFSVCFIDVLIFNNEDAERQRLHSNAGRWNDDNLFRVFRGQ